MEIGVIEVPTLKELFIEKIEEQILSGKLAVGEKLPSERSLEESTRISKTVIHDGLVELEKMGFIEIVPRKGAFVANYLESGTLEAMHAFIRFNGGSMTISQAESLLEARYYIEGTAMKKLALSHTDDDIACLAALLDEADAAAAKDETEVSQIASFLFRFHRSICVLSGNSFFPLLLNEFEPIILTFWEDSVRMFGVVQNLRLARRYLNDISSGDGDGVLNRLTKSSQQYLNCLKNSKQ